MVTLVTAGNLAVQTVRNIVNASEQLRRLNAELDSRRSLFLEREPNLSQKLSYSSIPTSCFGGFLVPHMS
jgi:hypothetical protein